MKNKNNLSVDQIEFACNSFRKWLQICEANSKHVSSSGIENSWLLRRLLSGKEPVLGDPPLRFGCPAWELIDRDEIEVEKIIETTDGITIDEHPGYSWTNKELGLLKYDRLNLHYQLIEKEEIPFCEFVDDAKKYKYHAKVLKKIKPNL